MKMRPTGTAYFLMAIFIAVAVFLIYSMTYAEFRTKFMPVLVSSMTLILTAVALVQEFMGAAKTLDAKEGREKPEGPKKSKAPLSAFLKAFGWLLLLVVAVYLFGFMISIPIWIFVYLWNQGHRWWSAMLQGAGAILIVYLVFVVLLQVDFYPGLIW